MTVLIIVVHVIACFLLISIVLIQQGRGGGLVESFSGVESMFGPKTSTFLTRTTTVLSVIFFTTCLGLAILSARQSRSLMKDIKTKAVKETQPVQIPPAQALSLPAPQRTTKAQELPKTETAQQPTAPTQEAQTK
jgi:preprotein translocase subunit SecG